MDRNGIWNGSKQRTIRGVPYGYHTSDGSLASTLLQYFTRYSPNNNSHAYQAAILQYIYPAQMNKSGLCMAVTEKPPYGMNSKNGWYFARTNANTTSTQTTFWVPYGIDIMLEYVDLTECVNAYAETSSAWKTNKYGWLGKLWRTLDLARQRSFQKVWAYTDDMNALQNECKSHPEWCTNSQEEEKTRLWGSVFSTAWYDDFGMVKDSMEPADWVNIKNVSWTTYCGAFAANYDTTGKYCKFIKTVACCNDPTGLLKQLNDYKAPEYSWSGATGTSPRYFKNYGFLKAGFGGTDYFFVEKDHVIMPIIQIKLNSYYPQYTMMTNSLEFSDSFTSMITYEVY